MRALSRSVCLILLVLAIASSGGAATAARKILVVQSSELAQLSYGRLTDSLKTELSRRFLQPINFVQFGLDPPGFSAAPEDGAVTYLRSLFAGHGSPDLIVTIGASAAQFIRKHGEQLDRKSTRLNSSH